MNNREREFYERYLNAKYDSIYDAYQRPSKAKREAFLQL